MITAEDFASAMPTAEPLFDRLQDLHGFIETSVRPRKTPGRSPNPIRRGISFRLQLSLDLVCPGDEEGTAPEVRGDQRNCTKGYRHASSKSNWKDIPGCAAVLALLIIIFFFLKNRPLDDFQHRENPVKIRYPGKEQENSAT